MLSNGNNYINPTATRLKAVDSGKMYFGRVDTDPTIPANQVTVSYKDESGNIQTVGQPIILNKSGVPVLMNGQVFDPVTPPVFSFALYDKRGDLIEYSQSTGSTASTVDIIDLQDQMMGCLNKGDYSSGAAILKNDGDYVIFNGSRFYANVRPHTTNPTTYPSPLDDKNLTSVLINGADRQMIDMVKMGLKPGSSYNNTPILVLVTELVNNKGGNCYIQMPKDGETYYYEQYKAVGNVSYYGAGDIMPFNNVSNLTVNWGNCIFKLADGTHFGSFDPVTGAATGKQTTAPYANGGGRFFNLNNSNNCQSLGTLKWDGNADNHIIGGLFGDTGYQIIEYGFRLSGTCDNFYGEGFELQNSGLDGCALSIQHVDSSVDHNITINRLHSKRNGRQALSFTGGCRINFYDTVLEETGRGAINSSPRAGMDIEPEGGRFVCYNKFHNFTSVDNTGAGVLTAVYSPRMFGNEIHNPHIIGTTSSSLYISSADGLVPIKLFGGVVRGSVNPIGNLQCDGTVFSTKPTDAYPNIYTGSQTFFQSPKPLSYLHNCEFEMSVAGVQCFFNQSGVKDAKVTASYSADDANVTNILGILSANGCGNITVIDEITGTGTVPLQTGSQLAMEFGSIRVVNNGHIETANNRDGDDVERSSGKTTHTLLQLTLNQSATMPNNIVVGCRDNAPTSGFSNKGDAYHRRLANPGSNALIVCTTGGVNGVTAVFKNAATIEA